MERKIDRCVVVTRKTQLQELQFHYATVEQARFVLQQAGGDFDAISLRHETYVRALDQLRRSLPQGLKLSVIDRSMLPQFEFLDDVVIAIGQDGLVSNTAKYLIGQPLIGINPDPANIEGILLPWTVDQAARLIAQVRIGKVQHQRVTLAEARFSDGRNLLAFNDLFVGQAGHASALYEISYADHQEFQSSSGIIISTGAGSTGWMRSIQSTAVRLAMGEAATGVEATPRESDTLQFAVREAWPSRHTGTSIISGSVTTAQPLLIHSHMPSNGVIFSDGIEWDFMEFNSGTIATISVADRKATLVVP